MMQQYTERYEQAVQTFCGTSRIAITRSNIWGHFSERNQHILFFKIAFRWLQCFNAQLLLSRATKEI